MKAQLAPSQSAPSLRPIADLVRRSFVPAAIGFAALLPLTAVHAQTPAPAPKDPKKETTLPEVKVQGDADDFKTESTQSVTRTDTPLRDIPQFVNIIPQSVIRSQNATSLTDALRNVPGVSYAAAEGGTQANQVFYLRGFPAGGDIYIDGVRDIGEYNRDLFATDSVEVLKGPSALMFGRGSAGGLVNQTTKAPGLVNKSEVALTLGDFDTKRITADVNGNMGDDNAFRIAALAEDSGAYRYPQDVKRMGLAPSIRFGIGHPLDITLSYYYLKTEDVTDYGQPSLTPAYTGTTNFQMPTMISPENYYGYKNHDFSNHETNIATAKIDWRIDKDTTLRNVTRYAVYERQVEATISTLAGTDANGAPVTPNTPLELLRVTRNHDGGRTRDNDDDVLINQTDITWKGSAGGMKHTVLGGLELARERLHRWNYILDANPNLAGTQAPTSTTSFLNPDPSTQLTYTKTPNVRAKAQGDSVAFYAQDQMELTAQWKALLGLRWEQYDAKAQTESYSTGVIATGPFSRKDDMWSGRAGVIYQPTDQQSYYVAAGNSYNPSGELGVYGGTGTNLSDPNSRLDPEENRSYEGGATWDFANGMQLRGALFRNEKINARMTDPASNTVVLAGKRRVDGIELMLAGHVLPNWEIYGSLALMDGKIVSGPDNVKGKTPLGVADSAGNLWTVYKFGGGWEVGGGVRYSSGVWLNDANTGETGDYTVFDLTAAYVRPNWEIRVNLQNVGDETYYVGGYQNSPNRVLPGSPRATTVTFRYTF
ncbi:TonB-dependent receptor [Usitatibacter palustris]|uniref:Putative TonB-dependent receptor BfrD n=1 Tax=Usitatibacter palustris TaxID=2732487 RepID=A0A6M4HAU0_9PROT|nr:TonB-dependent siderophore receptor [Usitatibacter palustris]QJR15157.1 putative TonB-dependent receptor BfrD [Usitatibacter palustris]